MKAIRWIKLLHLLCWTLLIAKLMLVAQPVVPEKFIFSNNDKVVHALLYGGLVYFLIEAIEAWFSLRYWLLISLVLGFSLFYATVLEYMQNFVPGRTVSSSDTIVALAGSVAAIGVVYFLDFSEIRKPKLLIQVCCIGCGAYVVELLKKKYRVTLYFYNPNIFPEVEYHKRLRETKKIAKKLGLKILVGKYRHDRWLNKIKGHEDDPERGGRCVVCYEDRLRVTARLAKQLKYQYFGSTLTISPHKLASVISEFGKRLAGENRIKFLDQDFKKHDGFKKSCLLSRELGLYRQDYCGCEFSIRKT